MSTDKIVSELSLPAFFPLFQQLKYGELHIKQDESSGLIAIIAIHSTQLGPALGGCRFLPYPTIGAALIDALRLAQGMSYKAAMSKLPLGGGKAVVIKPPGQFDRPALFRSFGQFIHSLGGRYITAADSGTSISDMDVIRTVTPFVTGDSAQTFTHKDPSPLTALGVRRGIEAAVKYRFNLDKLEGIHVAIQGVGHVGYHLAKELYQLGVKLTVCDINQSAQIRCQKEFSAAISSLEFIHQVPCDVFAPCALSNAVTFKNVHEIQAPIIAGASNNQLEGPELAFTLKEKGILYAPDYVINAGGLIHVCAQYHQDKDEAAAKEKVLQIYHTLLEIFVRADSENKSTLMIANEIVEQRLKPS